MKFDVIIGNPPYNDSEGMKSKKNGANAGRADFYKHFIHLSNNLLTPKGLLAFIVPPGAFRTFYSLDFNLYHQYFNPIKVFGKQIATMTYFVGKSPENPITNTHLQNKFLRFDKDVLMKRIPRKGYFVYSYIQPTKLISFQKWDSLSNKEKADKYRNSFNLTQSELNFSNLRFLLNFFSNYLNNHGAMWSSFNKKLKYQWLEGLTYEITEQDIINQYCLTPEEIKIIKGDK